MATAMTLLLLFKVILYAIMLGVFFGIVGGVGLGWYIWCKQNKKISNKQIN